MSGNEWATFDEATGYTEEKTAHIAGTVQRSGGRIEFWLTPTRPDGWTVDEWEEFTTARWERIFGKKEK